jgi:hypothetical protein
MILTIIYFIVKKHVFINLQLSDYLYKFPSAHWGVYLALHFVFSTFDRLLRTSPALRCRSALCRFQRPVHLDTAQGNIKGLQRQRNLLAVSKQQLLILQYVLQKLQTYYLHARSL